MGHVECNREKRNAYKILVGKPEGKSPFGKTRRRWEFCIKCILENILCQHPVALMYLL
jgi:hypothetical protein